jgi:hypothetical protein
MTKHGSFPERARAGEPWLHLLYVRMEDFRENPEAGIPLEQLTDLVRERLGRE